MASSHDENLLPVYFELRASFVSSPENKKKININNINSLSAIS